MTPGLRILDVGRGLGGPAHTLAVEFGCNVTEVDLTESYVQAVRELTARLGLTGQVTHQVRNALELPFEDGQFDVVWTQNSAMNIHNKELLYASFRCVLRLGRLLALGEPMAGQVQPPIFPLMWAVDETTSFLRSPTEMRALIEATGFDMRAWNDVTPEPKATWVLGHRLMSKVSGFSCLLGSRLALDINQRMRSHSSSFHIVSSISLATGGTFLYTPTDVRCSGTKSISFLWCGPDAETSESQPPFG